MSCFFTSEIFGKKNNYFLYLELNIEIDDCEMIL